VVNLLKIKIISSRVEKFSYPNKLCICERMFYITGQNPGKIQLINCRLEALIKIWKEEKFFKTVCKLKRPEIY